MNIKTVWILIQIIQNQNGKSTKIESDSNITLIGIDTKHYHFECQSNSDKSMIRRMFEYDSQIGIEHGKIIEQNPQKSDLEIAKIICEADK